jgi:CRISPR-associated protein Cas2
MRIFVMLAPTNVRGTKTAYTKFRKRLVASGFVMLQAEVYMKAVPNREVAATQMELLTRNAPPTGTVRAFTMTERQFAAMHYLTGGPDYQERMVGAKKQVEL